MDHDAVGGIGDENISPRILGECPRAHRRNAGIRREVRTGGENVKLRKANRRIAAGVGHPDISRDPVDMHTARAGKAGRQNDGRVRAGTGRRSVVENHYPAISGIRHVQTIVVIGRDVMG